MDDEILDPERDDKDNESSADSETKNGISADLIRGHINTIILRTLYERDKYGYEIIEEIETKSHGQYSLKQPTLYSALKRLESQGYINAYWKTDEVSQGGRRKYYTLTDSGREITEKNQAEWEYSRTVIDNLISDKNFDFTQPPPAAVDFKILKNSTSRVPSAKDNSDDSREIEYDEPESGQVVEIRRDAPIGEIVTNAENSADTGESATPEPVRVIREEPATPVSEPAPSSTYEESAEDEQRRILHENYLKLISEPAQPANEGSQTPYADMVDTDKLIYNNRPETERDYKNLINNIFMKTVTPEKASAPAAPQPKPAANNEPRYSFVETVRVEEAAAASRGEIISAENSENYSVETRKKRYNLSAAMLKCSLIVGVIMLLEFALCLIFRDKLGANESTPLPLTYPFVILAIDIAQVLLFGTLYYAGIGKSIKPSAPVYLSACIICTLISILIIVLVALLFVNFSYAGDLMAKIFIPCFVALNITIFGILLYLFSRR